MTAFIQEHDRYWTMNSWNGGKSFSNNVKIHRLGLPKEVEDRAYECWDDVIWDMQYRRRVEHFQTEFHDYQVIANGRSGGYLVLYNPKHRDEFTDLGDLDSQYDWPISRLREVTILLMAFDRLCDDLREDLIGHCTVKEPLLYRLG